MASNTFSPINRPGMKADCAGEITLRRTLSRREARSFDITLYKVFKQAIGQKSVVEEAFVILGMRTSVVAFHCFKMSPELKNSWIASHTSGPMISQQAQKNSGG